ncbi:MAG: primosomal protein N', partial [Candidatus Eremiobacteraeota bacterium]|nr:primosomal protein N' [Candidatus Eremiobacteraeota bacterium]
RLIVIDEAHERTYKQDGVPRYDALDVAREKMRLANGTLVLGSATPPLEAYRRALAGEIVHLRLDRRATELPLPAVHVVDLAAEFERGNKRIFSTRLVDALGTRLERGEKSVLFINRRGTASFMLCRNCGAVPECARCSISLTVHRGERLLRCHLCDAQRAIPAACPACGGGPIRECGVGTERVAEAVQTLFPKAHVVRMDSDTTTRVGDHARLLDEFAERGDVLVGTQMVAKGLDFPTVTLAGVIAADVGLHAPDFRAAERTFDLITQVAGRSGRARAGEAIVQTYAPEHPAIVHAARHDYDGFAAGELAERRALGYPPFSELIYLGTIGRVETAVAAAAARYAELLRGLPNVEVLGPAPYPIARANDEWRYRVALKAADTTEARRFIRETLVPLAAA